MPDRSGPDDAPRPRTIWQPEQPPAPKKYASPDATCSGGAALQAPKYSWR